MKKKTRKLPHITRPCSECPFRRDSLQGWLGEGTATLIIGDALFTCHKTQDPNRRQCAGHMLLLKEINQYYRLAKFLGKPLNLTGGDLVFTTPQEFIHHHSLPPLPSAEQKKKRK